MYAIERKENLTLEITALLARIDELVNAASSEVKHADQFSTEAGINKLNVVKTQAYKMKHTLQSLKLMTEEEWIAKKEVLQTEFKEANDTVKSAFRSN